MDDVFVESGEDSVVLKCKTTGDVYSVWSHGKAFTNRVWDYFNLGLMLAENPGEVLVLGLGGGTIVKQFLDFFGCNIDAVELSPKVIKLAEEHFDVKECERLSIYTADALDFLKNTSKKYDVIIVDVFKGDIIPEKFRQLEFIHLVWEHLNDSGVVVFNTITTGNLLLTSDLIFQNARKAFPSVFLLDEEGNRLVVALKFKAGLQDVINKIDSHSNPIFEVLKPKIKTRLRQDEPQSQG
ncbi:MAG: methyltransferase domain-containing protein [Candidatus Altiarchaeales archaeon]|nr:methyltransferase domain-containing protein [Candidatus Altiarchaeales archaeon]